MGWRGAMRKTCEKSFSNAGLARRVEKRRNLVVSSRRASSVVKPPPTWAGRPRRLVTKRALWHSGWLIRRAGGPRDFRDLGFLRARRARRAENQPRACHRAQFVTNLRADPAEPPRPGPSPPNQPASGPLLSRRRRGPASLPRADRPGAPEGPQPAEQGPSAAPGQRGPVWDPANRGSRQSRFNRAGALPNKLARTLLRPQTAPRGAQEGDSAGRGRIRSRRHGRSPQISRAGFSPGRVFPYIAAGILRNPFVTIPSPPRSVYILWRRERQSKRGRRSV